MLETLQRGVERALLDQEHVVRQLANPRGNRPAMERLERERLQDEEIKRALDEVDRLHGDYLQQLV